MSSSSPADSRPLGVALLGSTGSIGAQAVDVLEAHPDRFRVVALATRRNARELESQAARLRPAIVALADDEVPLGLPAGTARARGRDALVELATRPDVDLVVVGTGGVVSLGPVLAALLAGKVVATANKETLVAGGHLVMAEAGRQAAARAARDPRDPLASRLAPADRLGALGNLAVPRRRTESGCRATRPHRIRRTVPRCNARRARDGDPRARAPAPDLDHGGQDHDRFRDARQQGPGGHRGTLAVRCRVRRDRRRRPSAERRPLGRPVRGRFAQGPARHSGHATSDPVRAHVPRAPPVSDHAARPRRCGAPRVPRARRGPVSCVAHRARRRPGRLPGCCRTHRGRRGGRLALPRGHARLSGHPTSPRRCRDPVRRRPAPVADRRRAHRAGPRGPRHVRLGAGWGYRLMELVQSLITVVVFIVLLGTLVLVHELGHFITARWAKVRVLEFGIGFPPRAKVLGRGKRPAYDAGRPPRPDPALPPNVEPGSDEAQAFVAAARAQDAEAGATLYTLNWLPIGGFVKLEGEDGDDGADPHSVANAKLWVKVGILLAGVTMNLLLAFALFTGIAMWGEPAVGVTVTEVVPGSPAAEAALEPGDTIATVDGRQYSAFDLQTSNPLIDIRSLAGQTVVLGIVHADGTAEDLTVTLREPATPDQGALGVSTREITQVGTVTYTPAEAISTGVTRTVDAFGLILGGLAD